MKSNPTPFNLSYLVLPNICSLSNYNLRNADNLYTINSRTNQSFLSCTTFHRYPIFSTRYSVMCKVYTGDCGTSEIEHGLCACTVDNPLAKARGLSLRTGAQPMLYLPLICLLLLQIGTIYLFRPDKLR